MLDLKRRSSTVFLETRESLDSYYISQDDGTLNYQDAFELLFFKLVTGNSAVSFLCNNCVFIRIEKKCEEATHIQACSTKIPEEMMIIR